MRCLIVIRYNTFFCGICIYNEASIGLRENVYEFLFIIENEAVENIPLLNRKKDLLGFLTICKRILNSLFNGKILSPSTVYRLGNFFLYI